MKKARKNFFESGSVVWQRQVTQPMPQSKEVFLLLFVHKKKTLLIGLEGGVAGLPEDEG